MFSITVSMKNKWKIFTSLVYVLVIMDNRYNNSNIFFPLFCFLWWHKISCSLVASPKKDLKMISPIFLVWMHRLLGGKGGFHDKFFEGVAFCCCFSFVLFDEKKSKPEVSQRQTGNGSQAYWHLQFFRFNADFWGKGGGNLLLFFLRAFWQEKSKPEVRQRQTGNGCQAYWHLFIWEYSWWWAVNPALHLRAFFLFFRCAFWREKSKPEVRQRQTGNGSQAYWHLFIWESSWWWAVNPASHLRHTNGRAWAWAWVMICWN